MGISAAARRSSLRQAEPERYNQIGYLFSLVPAGTATQQADMNLAIWKICTPTAALTLSGNSLAYYNTATGGAYSSFDYTQYMRVLTPNPLNTSQEFLTVPNGTPLQRTGTRRGMVVHIGPDGTRWRSAPSYLRLCAAAKFWYSECSIFN